MEKKVVNYSEEIEKAKKGIEELTKALENLEKFSIKLTSPSSSNNVVLYKNVQEAISLRDFYIRESYEMVEGELYCVNTKYKEQFECVDKFLETAHEKFK